MTAHLKARIPIARAIRGRGALAALAAVFLFAMLRYEAFMTPENPLNVLRQNRMLDLVAIGMTFVVLTGGIDLSSGALVAVAGAAAAAPGAIACTCLLGALNGLLVARGRIPPFIATLCVMIASRGAALALTGEEFVRVNRTASGFAWLGRGYTGPGPVPIMLFLLAAIAAWLVLSHTRLGRRVYAIGENQHAARLMGLNEAAVLVPVYALSGALAGLAGVILASRFGMGQPVAGTGWTRIPKCGAGFRSSLTNPPGRSICATSRDPRAS